jgi:hypothetical protein
MTKRVPMQVLSADGIECAAEHARVKYHPSVCMHVTPSLTFPAHRSQSHPSLTITTDDRSQTGGDRSGRGQYGAFGVLEQLKALVVVCAQCGRIVGG